MMGVRPRLFPEWPVHLLIWALLLVKNVVATLGAPAYPVPKTAVLTYWLLGLGYLLVNATAFYASS